MSGSMIDVATADGVADCYLARPADGRHPAVLLMIDAIGLRARIEEMADRIAAAGYIVLAPNVFYRAGPAPLWETPELADPEARGRFMQSVGPLITAFTPDRIAADGGAYLGQLAELADGPVGITGYCLGGRLGWTIAAGHRDRVGALGGFHTGRMVSAEGDSPHLLAPEIAAEVYWGHADQDQSMTPENIATLDRAMDDAGVRHTTKVYAGAGHGYTMSDMGAFDQAACERHFEALFDLLNRTLRS